MIDRGAMRPDWCFVAEGETAGVGPPEGRYAFWTLPKVDHPEAIVLFEMVEDAGRREAIAGVLLAHSLAGARG